MCLDNFRPSKLLSVPQALVSISAKGDGGVGSATWLGFQGEEAISKGHRQVWVAAWQSLGGNRGKKYNSYATPSQFGPGPPCPFPRLSRPVFV